MSYDAETARQKLTGDGFDECILNEREQRHGITVKKRSMKSSVDSMTLCGDHVLPQEEYEELLEALRKRMPRLDEQFLQKWRERHFIVTDPGQFCGWLSVPSEEYIALRDSYIATLPKEEENGI